jgi:hypothetical protein
LLLAGFANVFAGCGPVDLGEVLSQLGKGGSSSGGANGTYDGGVREPPPKPEPPRCEPTRVPPPPPGPPETACPSLKDECTDGTPIFCVLDGRRAVVGCGGDGFRRVLAIDGEITCDDPPQPPPQCKPVPKTDCKDPVYEDRDGDGCIDYYACRDDVPTKPVDCAVPPPPPDHGGKIDVCPAEGSACKGEQPVWCTVKDRAAIVVCDAGTWLFKAIDGICK